MTTNLLPEINQNNSLLEEYDTRDSSVHIASNEDQSILKTMWEIPFVCQFVRTFRRLLGTGPCSSEKLERGLCCPQTSDVLAEVLSKLLLDSKAKRDELLKGRGMLYDDMSKLLCRVLDDEFYSLPNEAPDSDTDSDDDDNENNSSDDEKDESVIQKDNKKKRKTFDVGLGISVTREQALKLLGRTRCKSQSPFHDVLPHDANPFRLRKLHDFPVAFRARLLKALCCWRYFSDSLFEELAQSINSEGDLRVSILGMDSSGNCYWHFPWDGDTFRIYKQSSERIQSTIDVTINKRKLDFKGSYLEPVSFSVFSDMNSPQLLLDLMKTLKTSRRNSDKDLHACLELITQNAEAYRLRKKKEQELFDRMQLENYAKRSSRIMEKERARIEDEAKARSESEVSLSARIELISSTLCASSIDSREIVRLQKRERILRHCKLDELSEDERVRIVAELSERTLKSLMDKDRRKDEERRVFYDRTREKERREQERLERERMMELQQQQERELMSKRRQERALKLEEARKRTLAFDLGNYCPACKEGYLDTDVPPMVECDSCMRWCHMDCDNKPCKLTEDILARYENQTYTCPACRGGTARKDPPDPLIEALKAQKKAKRERQKFIEKQNAAKKSGDSCPICTRGWLETDDDMIQCEYCHKWVHRQCDSSPTLFTLELLKLYEKQKHRYMCPTCRHGAPRDDPVVKRKINDGSSKNKKIKVEKIDVDDGVSSDACGILLGLSSSTMDMEKINMDCISELKVEIPVISNVIAGADTFGTEENKNISHAALGVVPMLERNTVFTKLTNIKESSMNGIHNHIDSDSSIHVVCENIIQVSDINPMNDVSSRNTLDSDTRQPNPFSIRNMNSEFNTDQVKTADSSNDIMKNDTSGDICHNSIPLSDLIQVNVVDGHCTFENDNHNINIASIPGSNPHIGVANLNLQIHHSVDRKLDSFDTL